MQNGVSRVAVRGVVRYAQRTPGSSSTQDDFTPSNFLLRLSTMVRLDTSVCPLDCGYHTEVKRCSTAFSRHQSWRPPPANCLPLSVTNTLGIPNRQAKHSQIRSMIYFSVIVRSALASIHLEKYSMATNRNFFCPFPRGKGPTISRPHWSNGHETMEGNSSVAGCLEIFAYLWQSSHFRTKAAASFFMLGQ